MTALAPLPRLDTIPVTRAAHDPFPLVDPGIQAVLYRLIAQVELVPDRIGSILITDDSKDREQMVTKVAKIVDIGPCAFHSRSTTQPWPGYPDAYPKVGDLIRIRIHGGERFEKEGVTFVVIDDLDIVARVKAEHPMPGIVRSLTDEQKALIRAGDVDV